jgi:hypothetical protein
VGPAYVRLRPIHKSNVDATRSGMLHYVWVSTAGIY